MVHGEMGRNFPGQRKRDHVCHLLHLPVVVSVAQTPEDFHVPEILLRVFFAQFPYPGSFPPDPLPSEVLQESIRPLHRFEVAASPPPGCPGGLFRDPGEENRMGRVVLIPPGIR